MSSPNYLLAGQVFELELPKLQSQGAGRRLLEQILADWAGPAVVLLGAVPRSGGFAVRVRLIRQKVWAPRPMGNPHPTWATWPA